MSFFEKLKNNMGIEETEEKEEEEEEEEKPRKSKMKKIAIKSNSDKEPEPLRKKKEAAEEESWFQPEGELAVDVYETDEDIIIQSTVAGVKPEDLDISIEDDVVTISGERSNEIEDEGKNYFYQECFWGTFSRQIILPQEVDANRAEAAMKDGVFTLRIPKLERQKVKKIKVRV